MVEELVQMKECISESDFLLIGIGEEFEAGMKVLEESNIYKVFLEKIARENLTEEDYDWMYPSMLNYALSEPEREGSELKRIKDAYRNLAKLISGKNYFLVTMNMDSLLQRFIGDDAKITAPFGSYDRIQCEMGCDGVISDADAFNAYVTNLVLVDHCMLSSAKKQKCEKCGGEILHNTVNSANYLEIGYQDSWEKYQKWLLGIVNRKLCIMELGVSLNCPCVIRFPFEKIGFYSQKSKFFRINHLVAQLTPELSERGVSISMNAVDALRML